MTGKAYQADLLTAADVPAAARLELIAAQNPIMNGGMDVWQRGTSFTSIASGSYSVDRWRYSRIGAVVMDIGQITPPALAATVPGSNTAVGLTVSTADASIAAGDLCVFEHRIEGYNWYPFHQKQFTIGFWVRSAVTGTHCVSAMNDGSDRSCPMEYTVNVANTWEYKTLTFPASPSAGTWNFTTSIGLRLFFTLAAGSDFQATAGSWQSAVTAYATANQVNAIATAANVFGLWGVTMGLGSTVAPFWPRSFGQELLLCQRYYQKTFPYGTAVAQNAGVTGALHWWSTGASGSGGGLYWQFPVVMRATPTMTGYNPSAANANWRNINDGADSGAINFTQVSEHGASVYVLTTAGDAVSDQLVAHATASAEL